MGKKYTRQCDYCKQFYIGEGKFFCSSKCKNKYRAEYIPGWKEKLSISAKKSWTPERRAQHSLIQKARTDRYKFTKEDRNRGGFKKGNIPWNKGIPRTDIEREKMSVTHRKNGKSKGRNNIQWQGGISQNPYNPDLTKYKKYLIYKRDNFTCQECLRYPLKKPTVHHIDYNKQNSNESNLITLCQKCNSKANFNREYWRTKYENWWISNHKKSN